MQVCLLGGGAIIGDMSVRESGGAPPRRSATVVALTELVTYKVPLKEFKRRMPADVLEVRGAPPGGQPFTNPVTGCITGIASLDHKSMRARTWLGRVHNVCSHALCPATLIGTFGADGPCSLSGVLLGDCERLSHKHCGHGH